VLPEVPLLPEEPLEPEIPLEPDVPEVPDRFAANVVTMFESVESLISIENAVLNPVVLT
jgi:hypothetical protein